MRRSKGEEPRDRPFPIRSQVISAVRTPFGLPQHAEVNASNYAAHFPLELGSPIPNLSKLSRTESHSLPVAIGYSTSGEGQADGGLPKYICRFVGLWPWSQTVMSIAGPPTVRMEPTLPEPNIRTTSTPGSREPVKVEMLFHSKLNHPASLLEKKSRHIYGYAPGERRTSSHQTMSTNHNSRNAAEEAARVVLSKKEPKLRNMLSPPKNSAELLCRFSINNFTSYLLFPSSGKILCSLHSFFPLTTLSPQSNPDFVAAVFSQSVSIAGVNPLIVVVLPGILNCKTCQQI